MAAQVNNPGWIKTTLREGTGLDQLGNKHGVPQKGDWVNIHYKGKVVSTGEEFEDTYHREKPLHFQIGSEAEACTLGLSEAAETMLLGEKCEVRIRSHFAYGAQGMHLNYGKVPPHEDVVLKCELFQINLHRRKQQHKQSGAGAMM